MTTMIAARLHAYGQPMTLDRIDVPKPRPTDVLVEVKACGVVPNLARVVSNFFGTLTPDNKMMPPLPAIFGLDPAGVVAKVGEQVLGGASGRAGLCQSGAVLRFVPDVPQRPDAWIVRAGRCRAISAARRRSCGLIRTAGSRNSSPRRQPRWSSCRTP